MLLNFTSFIKNYLAKIKNLTVLLSIFFMVSVFMGYALAHSQPGETEELLIKNLESMIEPAKTYAPLRLFEFIFLKNLLAALVSVFSGIILGFIPVLAIFTNGVVLGAVSYIFLGQNNMFVLLAGILPHGIIEIPALILSAASGVWLWQAIYRRIFYGEKKLGEEFSAIVRFFFLAILPMLFLAAIAETFITPIILNSAKMLF